ncbi:protein wings apart-like [Diachasma alloeum]|uniref:protein wings apart-like n=1 Tax=Diachasma alloeum TaxID=454923 RepID=UPI000738366C|nr:protein wings apart-like [Diachasma alloeum]
MTSRSYTKSYSRKVNSVTPGSIQFDKLFRENSNRPSAAKSAGTVGKWGITSFTSIRSTNINGRRDDIQRTFGAKKPKLDYSNQNAQVPPGDPFSFDTNLDPKASAPAPAVPKPKKFFKSRNLPAATPEEPRSDPTLYRQVPDSQYVRKSKHPTPKAPKILPPRKTSESLDGSSSDTSIPRDDKPPIVLRICKGTARLLSGDSQESHDDPEMYRVTTPVSPTKSEPDRKSFSPEISRPERSTRSHHQPTITTVSIPLDSPELSTRRTTRSRAKNLNLDLTSAPILTSPPPTTPTTRESSGLSLTLRKSITDSNNTSISHYDIVKTDCTSYKPIVEPLIGRDQPLPTTTQELIDILSSDNDVRDRHTERLDPPDECEHQFHKSFHDDSVPRYMQDSEPYHEPVPEPAPEEPQPIDDKSSAKTLLDQDWFSGSEDSEAASGNTEPPTNVPSPSDHRSQISLNPPVKPVTKKGSIFKSRSTGATNGNKRRALYKHKWCDNDKESITPEAVAVTAVPNAASGSGVSGQVTFDEELDEADKLTRVVTYPETDDMDFNEDAEAITSIRCGKRVKGFYTVVKNVKKAHQIQESGEFQEFNDDVEYILDTLRENNPNATRCLSAIRLASKCMAPAFRMHVRAHGTVAKFFKALHDATKDQSLGLCTATVMFVLSQDRLAMDLDRDCLELMLSLLESDASHKDALDDCGLSRAELLKNKEKVRQLCADIQAQGHAKHLNLDNITVGQLAMETLLSLTSKRAGEWFKEELRELGGLEHIVKTIKECHRNIVSSDVTRAGWDEPVLDKLRKVDRCLRVLENVTQKNEENQNYLLKYDDGVLVSTLSNLYYLCGQEITIYPIVDISDKTSTGAVIRECIIAILNVLINLTHRFNRQSFGSKSLGSQNGVVDCSLNLLLRVPESLPEEKRFDMMMLTLILLINLVEQCDDNKKMLMESRAPPSSENIFDRRESGVEALIDLFYKQEELAISEEQKTDAILDGKKDSEQTETVTTTKESQDEFIEKTVQKLLQKAGRHMEHTLIGAYVVLLLGYLIMDNKEYEALVRGKIPGNNFSTMVAVLQKFYNFMNLTASSEASSCGIQATDKVIKFLKLSDARIEEERNALPLPALEESSIMPDLPSS